MRTKPTIIHAAALVITALVMGIVIRMFWVAIKGAL